MAYEPKVSVKVATGEIMMRVGCQNIKEGQLISLSRRGYLRPIRRGHDPVGVATTHLKANSVVSCDLARGKFWDRQEMIKQSTK